MQAYELLQNELVCGGWLARREEMKKLRVHRFTKSSSGSVAKHIIDSRGAVFKSTSSSKYAPLLPFAKILC